MLHQKVLTSLEKLDRLISYKESLPQDNIIKGELSRLNDIRDCLKEVMAIFDTEYYLLGDNFCVSNLIKENVALRNDKLELEGAIVDIREQVNDLMAKEIVKALKGKMLAK